MDLRESTNADSAQQDDAEFDTSDSSSGDPLILGVVVLVHGLFELEWTELTRNTVSTGISVIGWDEAGLTQAASKADV